MPSDQDLSPDGTGAPSDGPVEGSAEAVSADDPHKAETLTSPSVDGDVGEVEE